MRLSRRTLLAAAGGTLAAVACPRKPLAAENLPSLARVLRPVSPPEAVPETPFLDAAGAPHRLGDFKGRGMVVNLWATWCAPCVAEMPSLQALSVALAPDDIAVLPLSSDRGGAATVQTWFDGHAITALPVLLDPKGALARAVSARGVPTTLIVDRGGQVVARLEGPADWAATDAQALIRKLVSG